MCGNFTVEVRYMTLLMLLRHCFLDSVSGDYPQPELLSSLPNMYTSSSDKHRKRAPSLLNLQLTKPTSQPLKLLDLRFTAPTSQTPLSSSLSATSFMSDASIQPLVLVCKHHAYTWLAVWCSGNALVLINAVALHRARLVLGWVTAFRQVNCLIT